METCVAGDICQTREGEDLIYVRNTQERTQNHMLRAAHGEVTYHERNGDYYFNQGNIEHIRDIVEIIGKDCREKYERMRARLIEAELIRKSANKRVSEIKAEIKRLSRQIDAIATDNLGS